MDTKLACVTTIAGADEVDQAIAPRSFWRLAPILSRAGCIAIRLRHIPRLFQALGTSSFEAGAAQRTSDGLGVALWLPPGVQGNHEQVEAVVAESIAQEKQADVSAVFEQTEQYRPTEPHWYLSLIGVEALHRNNGCGVTAARPSPMRSGPPFRAPLVIESAKYFSLRKAWLCDHRHDSSGRVAFR